MIGHPSADRGQKILRSINRPAENRRRGSLRWRIVLAWNQNHFYDILLLKYIGWMPGTVPRRPTLTNSGKLSKNSFLKLGSFWLIQRAVGMCPESLIIFDLMCPIDLQCLCVRWLLASTVVRYSSLFYSLGDGHNPRCIFCPVFSFRYNLARAPLLLGTVNHYVWESHI